MVGKVTNLMTQRSANVTGDVAEPCVYSGTAAMNVEMNTKLRKFKSLCPPCKKIKNCTCLLRAQARRINFGHVLCCHSQGLISASQYAHCSNAEAASVILILFTTLTHHASTLTVVNMCSRKEN